MHKRILLTIVAAAAASLASPVIGRAQAPSFKVDKYDIKGDGGTDYVSVDSTTGRVFVSRSTHVMVVEGATGKVVGDIPDTPGVHGAGVATKAGHGFTTNGGDSTVTMFDLKTLAVIKHIKVESGGLDGIMYDEPDDKVILTNHSRPDRHAHGNRSRRRATSWPRVELEDTAPEGAAADGKGRIFVNNEGKNTIQVVDAKTWKAIASWPLAPCEGPTGIAYDKATNRIFSGCSRTSVVVDAATGKVVASIANGTRVDALGWDPRKKAHLHPQRRRRQRHGRPPGRGRQVHRRRDGADVRGREDDLRRPEDARRRISSSRSADRRRRPRPDAPPPAGGTAAVAVLKGRSSPGGSSRSGRSRAR